MARDVYHSSSGSYVVHSVTMQNIVFNTDNMSVTQTWKRRSLKDRKLMTLTHQLYLTAARGSFMIN